MKLRTLLLLAAYSVTGCTGSSTPLSPGDTAPTASTPIQSVQNGESQSFGDFSFSIPNGWSVATPDRDKTKAMLLLGGTNSQNAKAMIKVDVGKPAAPTANQLAEGFASGAGGTVSPQSLDFDGAPGASVSTSSSTLTTPRNMIIIYRNDQAYLLMAGANAGVDVGDAVSHIRQSWKWMHPNGG